AAVDLRNALRDAIRRGAKRPQPRQQAALCRVEQRLRGDESRRGVPDALEVEQLEVVHRYHGARMPVREMTRPQLLELEHVIAVPDFGVERAAKIVREHV